MPDIGDFIRPSRSAKIAIDAPAVRVKGGMSLRNGMWKDVRNGIIMQNKNCGMT